MEPFPTHTRQHHGHDGNPPAGRRGTFKNKTWVSGERSNSGSPFQAGHLGADAPRWERGGITRGAGRGHGRGKGRSPRPEFGSSQQQHTGDVTEVEDDAKVAAVPVLETPEERERYYQELVRAREAERKRAIAEGKMDDPLAITMVGTCMDMCPRFERYRRERLNNLFNWEFIPGTKLVDHKRAGDKTLPSDLRPPPVLKRTLNYLFRELLPREGFSPTFDFIRDRSRAVRNDFTMQHETGPLAIECHERCARFHILALHFERDRPGFSIVMEEQQLMNTLQSLKEFYGDQRDRYDANGTTDIPPTILSHPHVQAKSSPISKTSPLIVDEEGMLQFSGLAAMLQEQGSRVMVYLVACILERLFGKDTIEDIEAIRDGISIPDIIDGVLTDDENVYDEEEAFLQPEEPSEPQYQPQPLKPSATEWLTNIMLGATPVPVSAFGSSIAAAPETATPSAPASVPPEASVFANIKTTPNVFGNWSFGASSAFGTSGSSSSAASGSTDVLSTLRDSGKANTSISPSGASTSAPIVSNIGDQGKPASVFGSPFAKPSTTPTAAASTPSGFPSNPSDINLEVVSKPPLPTAAASGQWHDQASAASVLNPKAPTFSPGQSFGTPSFTTSVQPETKSTTKIFSSSSPFPKSSTSTTPTRPILPPIDTSPHTSVSSSSRPPVNFTTSQSAPSLNGSTKHRPLERQPTITDGFRPSTAPSGTSGASTTPQQPPPPKMQPISLPGTPTSFSPPTKQKSSNNLFGWPSILSPLVISAKTSFVSLPSPPISARPSLSKTTEQPEHLLSPKAAAKNVEMASPTAAPTAAPMRNGKSKGKGKAPAVDTEELEARASAFTRTSAVVRDVLKRWAAKASERVLYNDAVRRSDAYTGQRTKRRQETRSQVDAESEGKRPARTRYRPPQTDAELAHRLKENHEQHERRWAPGTFLAAVHTRVGNPAPFDYCLWLSLNPENDGTAIWVERKFDMPNAGAWVSEQVFSIPLLPGATSRSPGLVVFECTPLYSVDDEIEKKYRVLDDCARLREVIETFPDDRHFIPSVLFILWNEDDSETLPDDLRHMTDDYKAKGTTGSYATFSLSSKTKDLDEKFGEVLGSMELDTAGGLVEILSRQEYLQLIIGPWKDFASDWVARCSTDNVDWVLFSKVFEVLVKLMNTLSRHFTTRLDESAVASPLPEILLDGVKSSSELYDAIFGWLEHKNLRTPSREFRTMLQSYRTPNADFPVHASVSALYDLSVRCIEGSVKIDRAVRYPVPKRDVEETKREVEVDVAEAGKQLCSVLLFHSRPKRPPPDEDEESSVLSMSPSSKRLKSTFSSFSTIDDLAQSGSNEQMPPPSSAASPSPSTSVTTIVNEEKPQKVVTVAMLRALTQSVLKKRPGM
ncbi:hypothetical protein F5888DRAFT_1796223 [Russula emetica]|nr:hypothetical protein F5888DRAFT_1796223 [Russula emetica]